MKGASPGRFNCPATGGPAISLMCASGEAEIPNGTESRRRGDGTPWEGEFPPIGQVVVVSPTWGRFHRRDLRTGVEVPAGEVIGHLSEDHRETEVRAPVHGVLQSWIAWDGERVAPGTPLASFAATTA